MNEFVSYYYLLVSIRFHHDKRSWKSFHQVSLLYLFYVSARVRVNLFIEIFGVPSECLVV